MKANISKCYLLVNKKDEVVIYLREMEIITSEYEKLLGIKVDTKLNFNEHLNDIISKAIHKVNTLSRVVPYLRRRYWWTHFLTLNLVIALLSGCSIAVLWTNGCMRGACI